MSPMRWATPEEYRAFVARGRAAQAAVDAVVDEFHSEPKEPKPPTAPSLLEQAARRADVQAKGRKLTVHYLHHGLTACAMEAPGLWPPEHKWSASWEDVTCAGCLAAKPPKPPSDLLRRRRAKPGERAALVDAKAAAVACLAAAHEAIVAAKAPTAPTRWKFANTAEYEAFLARAAPKPPSAGVPLSRHEAKSIEALVSRVRGSKPPSARRPRGPKAPKTLPDAPPEQREALDRLIDSLPTETSETKAPKAPTKMHVRAFLRGHRGAKP